MMALPALFKWEDYTPTQQIFPVLWYSCSKELYFWRVSCLSSFMLLALETSFRFVAKRRSGSAPCCSFFFCICFYVVLHRSMEHIPFHLSPSSWLPQFPAWETHPHNLSSTQKKPKAPNEVFLLETSAELFPRCWDWIPCWSGVSCRHAALNICF